MNDEGLKFQALALLIFVKACYYFFYKASHLQ